jgi:hypothetical protein
MPSKIHVHTDFSGGVVDRRIEGRTDANQYDKTMRAADNFVVTRSGTLRRRPGTIYLGDAFTRGGTTGSMSNTSITQDFRLVPWDTSDGVRSLLAIGKTMVSLYENEAPSVTPDGVRGGTAKFIRPINRSGTPAFIGQGANFRLSYNNTFGSTFDQGDYETEAEETSFNTTKFLNTDIAFSRACPVGDVCYIAHKNYPLHACVKDNFYNPDNGNPEATASQESRIYNIPVGYLDGPYDFEISFDEAAIPLAQQDQQNLGPQATTYFSAKARQLIGAAGDQFPCGKNHVPTLIGEGFDGEAIDSRPFGHLAMVRLSLGDVRSEREFPDLAGAIEAGLAKAFGLSTEATQQDLVDYLNSHMSVEHPFCLESPTGTDGKIKRYCFNALGAFIRPKENRDGSWAEFWGEEQTEDDGAFDLLGGNFSDNRDQVILLARITGLEGHDDREDFIADKEYNFVPNPTTQVRSPYLTMKEPSEGFLYQASGAFRWGLDVDQGVRAIHETQDRLGVVFEADPSRVFYTRTSGFSLFETKNGLNRLVRPQKHFIETGNDFVSRRFLRSRAYLDFGTGLRSDVLSLSASDGFDVLPDGLNGSRINHLSTLFDGTVIFTERGCAILTGSGSSVLSSTAFLSRKINSDGAMRSCEPQNVDGGLVYMDSTGSKLFFLQPASNSGTSLRSTDVSYTSRSLLTPNAVSVGGNPQPPVATQHRSMSMVNTPVNQVRLCKSDGTVVNFSLDPANNFLAFTSFSQTQTSTYQGKFRDYAQLVSQLGGYVYVSNLATRSSSGGAIQRGEILRETLDPDQGSQESLITMDRMSILVDSTYDPPDPDDDNNDDDGGDNPPDPTEGSRVGQMLTSNFGQTTANTIVIDIQNWLQSGDEITITPEGPSDFFGYLVNTDGSEIDWSLLKAVCTAVDGSGFSTLQLRVVSDNSVYTIAQDGDPVLPDFDKQAPVRFTKIQDAGGDFFTGKSLASFPHLANETVTISIDGTETTTSLDSAGATAEPIATSFEKFIGLPFASVFESMPLQRLARLSTADDSRISMKRIYRAFLRVIRSVGGKVDNRNIDYTEGETKLVGGRYDGIVEHQIDSSHKIDETLSITDSTSNMLEIASITYEIDSGGVS